MKTETSCQCGGGHGMKKACNKSWALLVLRLAAGAIFLIHGYGKLFGNAPGMEGFTGMLLHLGFPMPSFWAYLVAVLEFFWRHRAYPWPLRKKTCSPLCHRYAGRLGNRQKIRSSHGRSRPRVAEHHYCPLFYGSRKVFPPGMAKKEPTHLLGKVFRRLLSHTNGHYVKIIIVKQKSDSSHRVAFLFL